MFTRGFPSFPRGDIVLERDSNKTSNSTYVEQERDSSKQWCYYLQSHAHRWKLAHPNTFSSEAKLGRRSRPFELR